MDKMKKKIIIFTVVFLLLFILFYSPVITPKDHFIISKEERLNIINKLSKGNCNIGDPVYLITTYRDKFHDKSASKCWSGYMNKCQYNKENNLTLKLPITCPTY